MRHGPEVIEWELCGESPETLKVVYRTHVQMISGNVIC